MDRHEHLNTTKKCTNAARITYAITSCQRQSRHRETPSSGHFKVSPLILPRRLPVQLDLASRVRVLGDLVRLAAAYRQGAFRGSVHVAAHLHIVHAVLEPSATPLQISMARLQKRRARFEPPPALPAHRRQFCNLGRQDRARCPLADIVISLYAFAVVVVVVLVVDYIVVVVTVVVVVFIIFDIVVVVVHVAASHRRRRARAPHGPDDGLDLSNDKSALACECLFVIGLDGT